MKVPENLLYTESHEWFDPETGRVGITDYAQSSLGDLVFLQVNVDPGDEVEAGTAVAEVESVKAVSDIFMPISGKITEINQSAVDSPEIINSDPYGEGWIFQIEPSAEPTGLLSPEEYQKVVEREEE